MKQVLTLLILFTTFSLSAQCDSLNQQLFEIEFDSVELSIWDIYFEELSVQEDGDMSLISDEERARVQLTEEKGTELLSLLAQSTSYDHKRALLNHYNIVLSFFHEGEQVLRTEISTMTGNVDVYGLKETQYFCNNCSKDFGVFIEALLNEHELIEQMEYDEVDLMGLR